LRTTQLKILKPISQFFFIFYRGSNHNFPTNRLYYLPTNFFDISFHFIISLRVCIVSYCKYNQRSVVSALLPTSKQNSMTASRDYMISTWCLWHFLLYASRLVLRHSSASHCRMHVWNGNMLPGYSRWCHWGFFPWFLPTKPCALGYQGFLLK